LRNGDEEKALTICVCSVCTGVYGRVDVPEVPEEPGK